ncbi:S-layer homology domain-containing protein [uncultured Dialister sp.]|uniref:S-layer homology domain-containing protein n=1 Tax=uncultured Dialister sp. TaxID=278064 RepID=UPI002591CB6B|nr:S-layer homology domain-containing protein [uncultured Dialister sp.]
MKKILAIAAAAALTAGVSAFAANPFSDVSTDDWAYQAVSDLSDQGVVEGYPDGTFKGERNITRYELAQIIARLMAKEDQLNAEQRATLDKLAGEYADELANLGVRVSNLEKKVGNLYWSGDARMRYQDKSYDKADGWNGRIRINVKGQVNDSTYVQGRMTSNMDFKGDQQANTYMDQLYVNHNFGKDFAVRLGRQPIAFGDQGGWLFNGAEGYDGIQGAYTNGKLALTTGYGQFNDGYKEVIGAAATDKVTVDKDGKATETKTPATDGADFYFARGAYDFDFAKLGVDYINFQSKTDGEDNPELIGANLAVPFGGHDAFNVFGEYWKNTTAAREDDGSKSDDAWNVGLGYSTLNLKKPGTFGLSVAYNEVGDQVYFGGTGWQTNILDGFTLTDANKLKFWSAIGDVVLQKNVSLHAEYAFAAKADGDEDPDDAWTVSLNYKF